MSDQPAATGVIHDIGYRHYDGPRLGRGYAVRALTVHSLRGVFGLGRTARSKILPFALVVIMLLPAVVSIAMMALLKQRGMSYASYTVIMQALVAIFLATQTPTLVAPDLRFRVLPLYLSRPVTTTDYVGAKLAAMTIATFALVAVPLTLLFVGELLVDLPEPTPTKDYVAALVMGLVLALLLSSVGLLIASLTPRRGLGVASVIAVYLLSSAVATVLFATFDSLGRTTEAAWAWLLNPFFLVDAVQAWLFDTPSANPAGSEYPSGLAASLIVVALIALAVTGLVVRYRKAASR